MYPHRAEVGLEGALHMLLNRCGHAVPATRRLKPGAKAGAGLHTALCRTLKTGYELGLDVLSCLLFITLDITGLACADPSAGGEALERHPHDLFTHLVGLPLIRTI